MDNIVTSHRASDEKALTCFATHIPEHTEYLLILDPFSHHLHSQTVSQFDNRPDDGRVVPISRQIGDK